MKTRLMVVLGLCLSCVLIVPSIFANTTFVGSSARIRSAGELKNQDMAFALLLEVYREYEGSRIQGQYEYRLAAVSSLRQKPTAIRYLNVDGVVIEDRSPAMMALRALVQSLVEQERNLEVRGLETRVQNFDAVYRTVRRYDEMQLGQTVPCRIDGDVAADQLRGLVAFVGASVFGTTGTAPREVAVDEVLRRAPLKANAPGLMPPMLRGPSQDLNPRNPGLQRVNTTPASPPAQRNTVAGPATPNPAGEKIAATPEHRNDVGLIIGAIGF